MARSIENNESQEGDKVILVTEQQLILKNLELINEKLDSLILMKENKLQ